MTMPQAALHLARCWRSSKSWRCGILLLCCLSWSACRSTDHHTAPGSEVDSDAAPATEAGEADSSPASPGKSSPRQAVTTPPGLVDCGARPAGRACCEALTPACNECRDAAQRELSAWQTACLKPQFLPGSCGSAPPVSDCCTDSTAACQACREQALNTLLAWKQACTGEGRPSCDRAPALAACCTGYQPSCDACRARNERLQSDWAKRCSRTSDGEAATSDRGGADGAPAASPPAAAKPDADADAD